MVQIRPAVPADAAATARCQIACWRETYGPLADPERLATMTADEAGRIAFWAKIIDDSPAMVRLADDNCVIVGFATCGPKLDPGDGVDLDRQLYALYTRQAYWGTGLGHRLLDTVLGDQDALLWVLGSNRRAVDFYRAHGFVADGAEMDEYHFGGPEIRMVRRA